MSINNEGVTAEIANSWDTKTQVSAAEVSHLLDYYGDKIKILSLDCFDTLLWRKTAAPKDVFYDMQHRLWHESLGVTAYQRIASAARAYRAKFITDNTRQVSLDDIYHYFTSLAEDQKKLLVEEELQTEIDLCYAFYPFVELIRQAKNRGIKVIIVSDTYLTSIQLKKLLSSHLPPEIMGAIDKIFSSLEYGLFKSEGLFQHVIEHYSLPGQTLLHIGDHHTADFEAPRKLGIRSLHFLQFNQVVNDVLRIQNSAAPLASLTHPTTHYARNARYSPFRGVFSLHNPPLVPETLIGYMTFGPILYAFSRFISDEIFALQQAGKKVKVFFLLRDAYLLYKACEAYHGKPIGELARIRKFVAVAASFRTQEDVDYYISGIAPQHYNMWVICEQLLLPHDVIIQIIDHANKSPNPQETFNKILHQKDVLELIFKNSAEARSRLKKYILKEMKLEAGDTLVIVDTGYIGVTQEFLTRALGDELNIEIIGRYFIASHEPDRPSCKALITSSWCEHGLFEQSCTYQEGSVLGYDELGNPIYDKIKLSDLQYQKVQAIQHECLRFISDAQAFFRKSMTTLSYDMLQKTAESALMRHIFFPTAEEIHYFKEFQHDKDMGDDLKKTMYNLGKTTLTLQQTSGDIKVHPYEARAINLDMTLSALTKKAFDLDFVHAEKSYFHEMLRIVAVNGAENSQAILHATQTADGYYSCSINAPANIHLGIVFGEQYQWVQIKKINLQHQPDNNFLNNEQSFVLNHMKKQKSLFECENKNALLMLLPLGSFNAVMTYQIIFRPIIRWDDF